MDLLATLNLWALFFGSLIAPTSLPGTSEALLIALAGADTYAPFELLAVAALGNSLGGGSSLLLGSLAARRWPPGERVGGWRARVRATVQRYGSAMLLLSWLPLVGDYLCVAAGWLRLRFWPSLIFIATGRLLRYTVVLGVYSLAV